MSRPLWWGWCLTTWFLVANGFLEFPWNLGLLDLTNCSALALFDAILMFRMLVLQALNDLSDEQVEPAVSRFLGLAIEDSIPDATTLWLFREKLAQAGLIEKLFDRFDQHLAAKGFDAVDGTIRCLWRKSERTTPRAGYALASSMCSGRSRSRRA